MTVTSRAMVELGFPPGARAQDRVKTRPWVTGCSVRGADLGFTALTAVGWAAERVGGLQYVGTEVVDRREPEGAWLVEVGHLLPHNLVELSPGLRHAFEVWEHVRRVVAAQCRGKMVQSAWDMRRRRGVLNPAVMRPLERWHSDAMADALDWHVRGGPVPGGPVQHRCRRCPVITRDGSALAVLLDSPWWAPVHRERLLADLTPAGRVPR